jgi:hypothetical protein
MKVVVASLILVAAAVPTASAAEILLKSPVDYQVIQRSSPGKGRLTLVGSLAAEVPKTDVAIEARLTGTRRQTPWLRVSGRIAGETLLGSLEAPAGGWWQLEVRVVQSGKEIARGSVAHVGIGEVFVVAGQSNSANHGEERQQPQTGRVAAFAGASWQLAVDPQPGASGGGGSFLPAFADAVVKAEDVPVGLVACGIGATSVREWLPEATTFPQPPTIESRVKQLASGEWASSGAAYAAFVTRMKLLGPYGFRAVLWHQGESDANQRDPARTLPGQLYTEYLTSLIHQSRRDIGWDVPWFVAQASYHSPDDRGSDDIRAAQAALWHTGVALEGPDTDALQGFLRDRDGEGVHFSAAGLREHGRRWADKVLPWLQQQWTKPHDVNGGTRWTDYAELAECHSIGWVKTHVVQPADTSRWDGVLDEAQWGKPSPRQILTRNWDWHITDDRWQEAVDRQGEGGMEEVQFDLWLPEELSLARGIVVISGHGSGETLFRRADLRALAKELNLALFKFVGNPLQRGFWPQQLLFDRLRLFGERTGHPELQHAPLFLYGHSNGTGFSAVFPAYRPDRVWAWVSMRPGITFQVYQPEAANVPGLVIFGEDDHFFARPSQAENLAVVPTLRKKHQALWSIAVEPKTGHGPGEKTWPLVLSFLRHTLAARVPVPCDCRAGPVTLRKLTPEDGFFGQNWNVTTGGYQELPFAAGKAFEGDAGVASWLVNAAFAADWQAFQRDGEIPVSTAD